MSLLGRIGPREGRATTGKYVILVGLVIFLLIGAVAGWLAGVIMKGGGFGVIGNIVVGVIGSLIGGWLFGLLGDRRRRTDWFNHSLGHRRDHPPRHYRADQACVALSSARCP